MLANFQVGKPLPEPIYSSLAKVKGERAFCSVNAGGGVDVYVVLDGISGKELEEYKGDVSLIYQDYELPFLVLKYKNDSFDMPLLRQDNEFFGNALTIHIVELKGFVLKSLRLLGLDEKMATVMKAGFESVLKKADADLLAYMPKIYAKYTAKDMCSGGVRQRFLRG